MRGGAPKKYFFFENALSGSIHSTYQKASLQTDQNPTLGHPSEQRKMETLNKDKGGGGSSNLDNTVHFYLFLQNFGSQNENRCAFPVTEDCETYPSFSLALLRETNKICKPLRHITDA